MRIHPTFELRPLQFEARNLSASVLSSSSELDRLEELAEFRSRVGRYHHMHTHHAHVTIKQRMAIGSARKRSASTSSTSTHAHGLEENEHLHAASLDLVQSLLKGQATTSVDSQLEYDFDPLQRHTLYRHARSKVDEMGLSQAGADRLKDDLNGMISNLMDQYGDVIRSGLSSKKALENAIGTMDALAISQNQNTSKTLSELRNIYGGKSKGKMESQLSPFDLAKKLVQDFGPANFIASLSDLRAKMSGNMRSNPSKHPGPQLWMSLSDATCFNTIQSCFAAAGDLRRDISDLGSTLPKTNQAQMTLSLLGVPEYSASQAETLIEKFVGIRDTAALQTIRLYSVIRNAIDKLPRDLWRAEAASHRSGLIDAITALITMKFEEVPLQTDEDEERENELHTIFAGTRKRENERGNSNQQDGGEGSSEEPITIQEKPK